MILVMLFDEVPQMAFYHSADALLPFHRCPSTIPQMPFDDSADALDDSTDILRIFRGEAADYQRSKSAVFGKFLVTSTVHTNSSDPYTQYIRTCVLVIVCVCVCVCVCGVCVCVCVCACVH